MSVGGKKSGSRETVQVVPQLDPVAQQALQQAINAIQPFNPAGGGLPAVAPLNSLQAQGFSQLASRPNAPFVQTGSNQLNATLAGGFLNRNPASQINPLAFGSNAGQRALENNIISAANRAVGDRFSAAGRSGSPAEAINIARTVSNELAPFQFNSLESERQRQAAAGEAALGRQFSAFENERGRQLQALNAAPQFDPLLDGLANRLLQVGGLLQSQAQLELDEPFLQLERFINPLLSAAGRFPVSTTQTGRAESFQVKGGFSFNPLSLLTGS